MQIVFHIGAHCTDQDRLIRSLLRNRDRLAAEGVSIPGPGRYRKLLSQALQKLRGGVASAETQDVLLEAVMEFDGADRVVISNESFICMPGKVLEDGQFYPKSDKSAWLRNAFPSIDCEFALGIRGFSGFLPALYEALDPDMTDPRDFLAGCDPRALRWSDYIARIQAANPGAPVTVWCDEDTPLIWTEILRELAGVDSTVELDGGLDLARRIMAPEGYKRLTRYLSDHPMMSEINRRRVLASFLSKYALEDAVEQEVALPGWDEALIEELNALYDEDVERIASMPGVTLIAP